MGISIFITSILQIDVTILIFYEKLSIKLNWRDNWLRSHSFLHNLNQIQSIIGEMIKFANYELLRQFVRRL